MGTLAPSPVKEFESVEIVDSKEAKVGNNLDQTRFAPPARASTVEPSQLQDDWWERWYMTLFDTALIVIPILLIVKIGLVISCFRQDKTSRGTAVDLASNMTTTLIAVNEQMVTLFTIIFVAIMATLVRRYALYKAQNGAGILKLEQYQGSVSLTGTLKMIISLRAWTWTSLGLCFIWAFYYLGSQAAKREFLLADISDSISIRGMVSSFEAPTGLESLEPNPAGIDTIDNTSFTSVVLPNLNGMFANVAQDVLDNWQNQLIGTTNLNRGSVFGPLIPNLEFALDPFPVVHQQPDQLFNSIVPLQDPNASKRGKGGWVDVSHQSTNYFTSFFGRPLVLQQYGSGTVRNQSITAIIGNYEMHSSYFTIGCSPPEVLPFQYFPNGTYTNSSISMNMTAPAASAPKDSQGNTLREFDFWYRWSEENAFNCTTQGALRATCNITVTDIDLTSSCKSFGCVPQQIRYRDNLSPIEAMRFNTSFDSDQFAEKFFTNLISFTGIQQSLSDGTDFVQYSGAYLLDPSHYLTSASSSLGNDSCSFDENSWQATFPETVRYDLSPRLTTLINSYYNVLQTYQSFEFDDVNTLWASNQQFDTLNARVTFQGNFYNPGYYMYWGWILIDFISCILLLAAGILCLWLRLNTLAPDIFGYVSSLTRDVPHLGLPGEGSTLSGLERTRLLKHVKIQIGDLHMDEEAGNTPSLGRVGVARTDTQHVRVRKLEKGRVYI